MAKPQAARRLLIAEVLRGVGACEVIAAALALVVLEFLVDLQAGAVQGPGRDVEYDVALGLHFQQRDLGASCSQLGVLTGKQRMGQNSTLIPPFCEQDARARARNNKEMPPAKKRTDSPSEAVSQQFCSTVCHSRSNLARVDDRTGLTTTGR